MISLVKLILLAPPFELTELTANVPSFGCGDAIGAYQPGATALSDYQPGGGFLSAYQPGATAQSEACSC